MPGIVTASAPSDISQPRPPVRPRRRRSDRAVANDERILSAAVEVLCRDGFDGLGMSRVARAAGLNSTGALYGRFENAAELAVWAWAERAEAALLDVSDRAVALLEGRASDPGSTEAAVRLAADLSSPGPDLRAALELLAVARRVEELEEVVQPAVASALERWGAAPHAPAARRAQVLGQLALTWGIGVLSLPASAPALDWWLVVAGSIGLAHDSSRPCGALEPLTPRWPEIDTGEPVRDEVLRAAGSVVARTGFERATVSRIARRAGYSTGVIYEYYGRKDDMISELVDVLLEGLYTTVTERDSNLIAEHRLAGLAGAYLAGYVQPEARGLQRLKVELYLAAAHQPALADALRRAVTSRSAALTDLLVATGLSRAEAALTPFAGRAIDHGVALVDDVAGPLTDVDWRHYMQVLVARNAERSPAS